MLAIRLVVWVWMGFGMGLLQIDGAVMGLQRGAHRTLMGSDGALMAL